MSELWARDNVGATLGVKPPSSTLGERGKARVDGTERDGWNAKPMGVVELGGRMRCKVDDDPCDRLEVDEDDDEAAR